MVKNFEDDKKTHQEELVASTSALAQSTVLAQTVRCGTPSVPFGASWSVSRVAQGLSTTGT